MHKKMLENTGHNKRRNLCATTKKRRINTRPKEDRKKTNHVLLHGIPLEGLRLGALRALALQCCKLGVFLFFGRTFFTRTGGMGEEIGFYG